MGDSASKPNEIVVYTANYCPYCQAAKRLLKSKGVAFREVDVTDNDELREQLVKMSGGSQTVPQVFVGGKCIGGYDDLAAFYAGGGKL